MRGLTWQWLRTVALNVRRTIGYRHKPCAAVRASHGIMSAPSAQLVTLPQSLTLMMSVTETLLVIGPATSVLAVLYPNHCTPDASASCTA